MSSKLQQDLEKRKTCYLESCIRQTILKDSTWDQMWDDNEKLRRDNLKIHTLCEARSYKPLTDDNKNICDKLQSDTYQKEHPIKPTNLIYESNDIFYGLTRLELVKRDPSRRNKIFFRDDIFVMDQTYLDEYWTRLAQDSLDHLYFLLDTADFHANYLLRLLYIYGDSPEEADFGDPPWRQRFLQYKLSEEDASMKKKRLGIDENFSRIVAENIKDKLLTFKYWLDEPFHAEVDDDPVSSLPFSASSVSNNTLMSARKRKTIAEHEKQGKYSGKDGQKNRKDDENDDNYQYEMTYWSENHQILFATAEYLAGQMWPKSLFQAGKYFRDEYSGNPGNPEIPHTDVDSKPHRDGDITGEDHMKKAKPRILRWLNDRLRFGFSEWNSPNYYKEDFDALFNLVDFCRDDEIKIRASMVLDLLIFDLARFTNQGSFGVSAGRAYADNKNCGFEQAVGDLMEVLFGSRDGMYTEPSSTCAIALASSSGYQVPDLLLAVGQDKPKQLIDRSRVSINFDEVDDYGIDLESEEGILFWWGKGAFFNKEIISTAKKLSSKYRLAHTPPFSKRLLFNAVGVITFIGDVATFVPSQIPVVSDVVSHVDPVKNLKEMANSIVEGSTLSRANLYCYKNNDAMLSCVQNFHPGQVNQQSQYCQATLGLNASVWTTHPSLPVPIFGSLGPDWWTGSN